MYAPVVDFLRSFCKDFERDFIQGLRDFIQGYLKGIIFFQLNFSETKRFQCLVFQGYFIRT